MEKSKVYFTDFRTHVGVSLTEKLQRLIKKAGINDIDMDGKFVAIKMHFGELGNLSYLRPNYAKAVADVVKESGGKPFLTDCNTLYPGSRKNALEHLDCANINGFNTITTGCQIIIGDGLRGTDDITVPVRNGEYCKEAYIGRAVMDADIFISLTHFKGHESTGFGGAIKNMSIGIASSGGKAWIHSAGKTKGDPWGNLPPQDDFLESMAEAAKAVADHCGDKILYISVANNLSVDCDCDASPEDPKMGDIGILASLDPIALDKACTDLVRASEDHGKIHLIERIDSRHGMHTLEYGEKLGIGSQKYELVKLDK